MSGRVLPEHQVVLSGVGQSAIGRRLPQSALALTLDAIQAAVKDAGLTMEDIDGLGTYPGMTIAFAPGFVGPDVYEVQDALGLKLGWHLGCPQGAAQVAPLMHAVLAVAAGLCRHAVVFRTVTESSGQSAGPRAGLGAGLSEVEGPMGNLLAVGAVSASNWAALHMQRHMHEYGTQREHLGAIAMTARLHAASNPDAIFTKPLSMDDYLNARPISTPLGLYDCDVPVDGCTAVVVSAAETRDDLRAPVRLAAMGGAMRHRPLWEQWEDLTTMAAHDSAAQMWSRTDLRPSDVDVAQLYDGFTVFTLLWLEAFGFCGQGEGGGFVGDGSALTLGGSLPVNTWGGQLSGGRLHGYGFVAEAMRQIRGEALGVQVPDADVVAVGVGGGTVAGCLLLTS